MYRRRLARISKSSNYKLINKYKKEAQELLFFIYYIYPRSQEDLKVECKLLYKINLIYIPKVPTPIIPLKNKLYQLFEKPRNC